ncbi:MAG: CAF17-like 4Fe-4S cluster assembly/insertion protein YgfZ [Deltaproteobacteria bacterium]
MKKTPLFDAHSSEGAVFEEESGWLAPRNYGNPLGEYSAARAAAAVADISHRGRIRLSGREHIKFLQGMLTNDVAKLEDGRGLYAALLTAKGRMIADMRVYRDGDAALLDLEPGLNEAIGNLLIKYRISYKANIEDATQILSHLTVQGKASKSRIEELLGVKIPGLAKHEIAKISLGGITLTIAEADRTGDGGYDIFVDSATVCEIWKRLREGIAPIGAEALEILRIEAAIPRYGRDMDENTIPIEAGIWDALSFDKGCYVGQEVIARIKWRGHVNRHLLGFSIEGGRIPQAGAKIFHDEREIGQLTSPCLSPHAGGIIALGYARREFSDMGARVSIALGAGDFVWAEIAKTPFYTGI